MDTSTMTYTIIDFARFTRVIGAFHAAGLRITRIKLTSAERQAPRAHVRAEGALPRLSRGTAPMTPHIATGYVLTAPVA